jgi:hypothetical protein
VFVIKQRSSDTSYFTENYIIILQKVVTPFYRLVLKQEPEALGELLSGLNVLEDELKSRGKTFFGGMCCAKPRVFPS